MKKILSQLKFDNHILDVMLINDKLEMVRNGDTWKTLNIEWFKKRYSEELKEIINLNDNYADEFNNISKVTTEAFVDNNKKIIKECLKKCNNFFNRKPYGLCFEIKTAFKNLIYNIEQAI